VNFSNRSNAPHLPRPAVVISNDLRNDFSDSVLAIPISGEERGILSIDGGGIHGIIPAIFLQALEQATGKEIWQLFDLIAGTSTGGILALALKRPPVAGQKQSEPTVENILKVYTDDSRKIFPEVRRQMAHGFGTRILLPAFAEAIQYFRFQAALAPDRDAIDDASKENIEYLLPAAWIMVDQQKAQLDLLAALL
jgi:hypothetical protein